MTRNGIQKGVTALVMSLDAGTDHRTSYDVEAVEANVMVKPPGPLTP